MHYALADITLPLRIVTVFCFETFFFNSSLFSVFFLAVVSAAGRKGGALFIIIRRALLALFVMLFTHAGRELDTKRNARGCRRAVPPSPFIFNFPFLSMIFFLFFSSEDGLAIPFYPFSVPPVDTFIRPSVASIFRLFLAVLFPRAPHCIQNVAHNSRVFMRPRRP